MKNILFKRAFAKQRARASVRRYRIFIDVRYNPRMRKGANAERFVARRIRRMVEGKPIKEWSWPD